MSDISFLPLTPTQKSRLNPEGERVWTEKEIQTMQSNLATYDKLREILRRRCAGCDYVLSSIQECLRLPFIGDVCDTCFHMHEALQHSGLKKFYYFRDLHQEWLKSQDSEEQKRRRDKLGL